MASTAEGTMASDRPVAERSGRTSRRRAEQSVAEVAATLLSSVAGGALQRRPFSVRFWDDSELAATVEGPAPVIVLRDPAVIGHLLREPNDLGLGRAWVAGMLEVEGDLDQVLGLRREYYGVHFSRRDRLRALAAARRVAGDAALRRPPELESEVRPVGRRHSRGRDAQVVRHHYDVPDSFYALVLGPSMVYSCAYFASPEVSLERAQEAKLDLICRKLQLRPGDRLLDIGCGWGSLILHAVRHYGVRAVGVTLSPAQASAALARIEAAGVAHSCEVRVADFREVADGPYDAIASVGMYEHVARRHYVDYARSATELLVPGGRFLNHGIAHIKPGPAHDRTFMRRFVFPDAELQPVSYLIEALEQADLELRDVESLREHYVLTLRRWIENLVANRDAAIAAGGIERERVWRLYMSGAAQAFASSEITVFQTLSVRPGGEHRLPLTREWAVDRATIGDSTPAR